MTLFDLPHNGTSTSIAAAQAKAESGTARTDRKKIEDYLRDWPDGATREQIAFVTGVDSNSVRPRVLSLIVDKLAYEDGVREWNGHRKSKVVKHIIHKKD